MGYTSENAKEYVRNHGADIHNSVIDGYVDFLSQMRGTDADQWDAYMQNLWSMQSSELDYRRSMENQYLERSWALADREHAEQYNDPSQQLARLMATGMSRQAAMAVLSGGESSVPQAVSPATSTSAPLISSGNAVANGQNAASLAMQGVQTGMQSFQQMYGFVAQQQAIRNVSQIESQYNGLLNSGYNLPAEFSGSPERQKMFLAACAGYTNDSTPSWITDWLANESNAPARAACEKIFNSKPYQSILTGGGLVGSASRSLYRDTFKDWISTRGFNAIETDADMRRNLIKQQYLNNNLTNIVASCDALSAMLDQLTMESLSGISLYKPDSSNPSDVIDTERGSMAMDWTDENGVVHHGYPRTLHEYINPETGALTDKARPMLKQYFAEVAQSAQIAVGSADPEMIDLFLKNLKEDERSKIAARLLQTSISSEQGDVFNGMPKWMQSAIGVISLLNMTGVTSAGQSMFKLLRPKVTRTRGVIGGKYVNSSSISW